VSKSLGKALEGLSKGLSSKGLVGELGKGLFGFLGKFIGVSSGIVNAISEVADRGDSGKDTSNKACDNLCENITKTIDQCINSILSKTTSNASDKVSNDSTNKETSNTPAEGSGGKTGGGFVSSLGKVLSRVLGRVLSSGSSLVGVLFKGISKTLGTVFTKITGKRDKTAADTDSSKLGQPGSPSPPKDVDTRAFDGIKRLFVSLGKVTKPLQLGIKGLISVFRVAAKTFQVSTRTGESLVILGILLAKTFTSILSSANSLVSGLASLPSSIGSASSKIGSIGSTILDTFTGIPNQLQSAFGGVISMIKSYSPAEAKQIEVAFGRLRATIGQILAPIAPMISNIVLNVARIIKDGASQIDIKGVFKWVVFFMSLTVGTVIAGVKLLVGIIRKLRGGLQGGLQGILSVISSLLGKAIQIVVKLLGWLLRQLPTWLSMLPRYLLQFISWLLTQLPDWLKTLSENLAELLGNLIVGLGTAIIDYLPNLLNDLLGLLDSLLLFVKKAFWNFVYGIPEIFSKLGTMVWEALKNALPGWAKRMLGISGSSSQAQAQPQQQGVSLNQLSTPEGVMKGAESFLKGIGLDEVGSVFGDMSKMFGGLFQKPEDEDLPFEAKEATTGTIEELGKKAREAALGVSGDPQKVTAESSKQTSDNTKAIRDSMHLLVTNNSSEDIARLVREAEVSNKSIQVLSKTSNEGVEVDKREKMKLEMSIRDMVYEQQKTNRLLMRMAYGQREIVEIERQREFGFQRAKHA
jgi:hypothetical protein